MILVVVRSVKEKKLYVSEHINNWSLVCVLQYPLKVCPLSLHQLPFFTNS